LKIPATVKFIAVVAGAYLIFQGPNLVSGKPIPSSLVSLYMFFVIVTLILAMTATEQGCKRLFGPIKKILLERRYRPLAMVLILIVPCLLAYKTYSYLAVGLTAPSIQRVIHPTPPRRISAYGKNFNLNTLKNPYRKLEDNAEEFRRLVKDGGVIYYQNCIGCHGAKLDGRGHLAGGLLPAPLPFIGSDTIAQLNEAYLFWRIVKGGAGLPISARPRMTTMPAWEDHLKEADIWKVILFLFDYTGNTPRAWKGKKTRKRISPTGRRIKKRDVTLAALTPVARGKILYDNYCWWCHGEEGYGDGPAALGASQPKVGKRTIAKISEAALMPPPRDLTDGTYKFKTTPFDEFYPSEGDIERAIKDGLNETAMPAWDEVLSQAEVDDLVEYLKDLAAMEEPEKVSIEYGKAIPTSKESIATGKGLFEDRCTECHGEAGRGNPEKSLKDDWGFRTWPGNLTRPGALKRSDSAKEIFTRITTGIAGSQMPSFADPDNKKGLTLKERWNVANYVMTLPEEYKRAGGGRLIKARKVEALSSSTKEIDWGQALFKTFLIAPAFSGAEGLTTPTIFAVSVKALYSEAEVALLIEWDDPTKSVPGLKEARKIIGVDPFADTLELRFSRAIDDPRETEAITKAELRSPLDFTEAGVLDWKSSDNGASAIYKDGRWQVIIRRPLPDATGSELAGLTQPVAIALRDGSNMEQGEQYSTTGWLWLAFEEDKGAGGLVWPFVVFFITLGLEIIWLKGAGRSED